MFTVWLGQRPVVVLCRYAVLRDALVLQADAFSGRGAMAVFERFTRGNGEAQGWAAGAGWGPGSGGSAAQNIQSAKKSWIGGMGRGLLESRQIRRGWGGATL